MNHAILLAVLLAGTPYKPTKKQCNENVGQCNCFAISQVEYKDCIYQSKHLPKNQQSSARATCDDQRVRRERSCRDIRNP